MTRHLKKMLILLAGALLIVLGVIGLMLPIVPQIPFFVAGLSVLATQWKPARDLKEKLEARFPKTAEAAQRFPRWVAAKLRRVPAMVSPK
ncbi:MAG: PGPGW domain-containing protein [Acidobacteriota bacterium]